jgi:type IX secretion system PorP/SprF family membrane protein
MKKFLTLLLIAFSVQAVYSQQDPLLSQFMFNKLAFNPAYAGSREILTVDAIYRNQWVGIDGAPKTLNLSVHTPLRNPHIGLGMYIYDFSVGPSVDQGVMATFAYRIIFPTGKLSFGLQGGIKYYDIDWSQITTADPGDPMLLGQLKQKVHPDANFGIYYYTNRFYVGFSSKQLLQNQVALMQTADKESFSKLTRHFYGMAGIALPLSEKVIFRPSALFKYVNNAPAQLDVNASFLFVDTFWVGVSYRTEKAVSFLTEFNVSKNLRLGYAYDLWFNELQNYNKGSHEIRLSLDLDVLKNRMLTPRYF